VTEIHELLNRLDRPPVFLTGPTGSGKTEVGIELAERLGAEIVSMDSMAVYRRMEIGTAKPSLEQRRRVPHYLLDVVEPWEEFSVSAYLRHAAEAVRRIVSRGKRVLFVGGTTLYLVALLYGIESGPPPNKELRRRLEQEAEVRGGEWLREQLRAVDPVAATRIHPNDRKRLIRAIEFYQATGRPISSVQRHFRGRPCVRAFAFYLDWPRAELYARINERTERMFASGWVDEVRALLQLPHPLSKTALQAHGYRPILDYLQGWRSLEEAKELTATQTRQYARRQLGWLRQLREVRPVPVTAQDRPEDVASRIVQAIRAAEQAGAAMSPVEQDTTNQA